MDILQTGGFVVNTLTMLVAIGSSAISYLVYKDSTSPDVIVYLEQNENSKSILNIVIKNIGKSAAADVKFSFDRVLPHRAFEGDVSNQAKDSALTKGIPFFAPGTSRVFMFGDYAGINGFIGDGKIKVTTTFRKANSRNPFSRKISNESYIEIQSMAYVDASDNSNSRKIAESLSKIEKTLVKFKQ